MAKSKRIDAIDRIANDEAIRGGLGFALGIDLPRDRTKWPQGLRRAAQRAIEAGAMGRKECSTYGEYAASFLRFRLGEVEPDDRGPGG